ncbi:hypothetical protein JL721_2141 [Aureococcus anophagefferens]|nr:hypothetical protein JL721_2141 [Aureococcus anophagefferens]
MQARSRWWTIAALAAATALDCEIPVRDIPLARFDDATALRSIVPVKLDTRAVRAALDAYLPTLHLNASKQCIADSSGRMWRMAPVDAFLVGYSRTGTTSLREELIRACENTQKGKLCAVAAAPAGEGELNFFNNPKRIWRNDYSNYLQRTRARQGVRVRCDDDRRECLESKQAPKLVVDKTPEYSSHVCYLLAIWTTNPAAKLTLSLRYPWQYFERHLRESRDDPTTFLARQWDAYAAKLRAAGCARAGDWAPACSLAASPFRGLGDLDIGGRWKTPARVGSPITLTFFESAHFVFLVDVLFRVFGRESVLVLRMDWCVARDVCGPRLAEFLGLPQLKVRANPYASWTNRGAVSKAAQAPREPANATLESDPMATMARIGLTRDMADDLLFYERHFFELLGWSWPRAWDAYGR